MFKTTWNSVEGREVGSMNTNRPLKTVAVSNGSEKKRVQILAIPSGFRVFFLSLPQFLVI
jgi:hypothetical protein